MVNLDYLSIASSGSIIGAIKQSATLIMRLYINGLTKTFNCGSKPVTENYDNSFEGFELPLKSLAIIETLIF